MNREYFDQIERFLDGEISRTDLEALFPDVATVQLETDIATNRNMRTAIEAAGLRDQLIEILPKTVAETTAETTKIRRLIPWKQGLAIAASILVLAIVYFAWPTNESGGLYAEFEYIDPGLPVLMSQSDDHALYDALSYYSEEDYETTIEKLTGLQAQGISNDTITFYLGASYLYQRQAGSAAETLSRLANDGSPFQNQAEWLLVLTALQQEDYDQAQAFLTKVLQNNTHPFHNNAQRLQTELKRHRD